MSWRRPTPTPPAPQRPPALRSSAWPDRTPRWTGSPAARSRWPWLQGPSSSSPTADAWTCWILPTSSPSFGPALRKSGTEPPSRPHPRCQLGTVDPSDVPSGYALQLSLGPLDSLVDAMRLARAHKYSLLLKMVQRIHQAGHAHGWPQGECLPARLVFGPHTPTDRTAILDEVVKGVGAGVLSLETGIRMLQDAGYPIEDAREEVERISARHSGKSVSRRRRASAEAPEKTPAEQQDAA